MVVNQISTVISMNRDHKNKFAGNKAPANWVGHKDDNKGMGNKKRYAI